MQVKQILFFLVGAFTSLVPMLLAVEINRNPQRWNTPFAYGLCIFAWVFIAGTTSTVIAYGPTKLKGK